jgi:hypothetical protein
MDAGIGCRWIPSAVDERSGGRATGGAGGALAFRPREVSGRAGWAGPRQGFGFSACARTVASVSAATPNGHLQGAGAQARMPRRRVLTVVARLVAGRRGARAGIFLERTPRGLRTPRTGSSAVASPHHAPDPTTRPHHHLGSLLAELRAELLRRPRQYHGCRGVPLRACLEN